MIDSSRANGTNASRISGTPPSSAHAAVDIGVGAQHRLALAVVAAAPGLQHRGQAERADRAIAGRRGSRPRGTARSRSTGRCTPPSRRAGPATTSSARAGGRTGAIGARCRAVPAGTPSHSYVTTARLRRPAPRRRDRRAPPRRPVRPCRRGRLGRVEERERARRAGTRRARASSPAVRRPAPSPVSWPAR